MKLRPFSLALITSTLSLLCACAGTDPVEVPDPDPVDVNATLTLEGGRSRALLKWTGLNSEVSIIRVDFGAETGRFDVPSTGYSGSRYLNGLNEGDHVADVSYMLPDGRVIPGGKYDVTVFGDSFESGLNFRPVAGKVLSGARAEIDLQHVSYEHYVGEKFCYRDVYGERVDTVLRSGDRICFYNVGGDITHRGVYSPGESSIDVFYSPADTIYNQVLKDPAELNPVAEGYRGIWFDLGQAVSSYGSKYSGGLGTYTMKHIPMAVYSKAVDRTFFVFGGTPASDRKYLLCNVGCYDHKTGKLQRPRIVMDKGVLGVSDPHDDPTIQIDRDGYIWVFVSGRGNKRVGKRYRSVNPYDITAFEFVNESIMAYPQVMYSEEKGFFLFFTRYDGTRQLFYQKSPDGVNWTQHKQLASIKEGSEKNSGHYQISNICGTKLCTAFNRHINGDVDTRTNIYYLQSTDWGETWTTADGTPVKTPVTERYSNCLVKDYQITTETHNCYIKDLNFGPDGNPVILYVTSRNHHTGPDGGTRQWHVIRWTGTEWEETLLTTSTHCYDSGSLWIDGNEWTVVAPTDEGPQKWGTGGEVVMWKSVDQGHHWTRARTITSGSTYNQTYMRRPWYTNDAFYSFWADGDPDHFTISHLYFCNRAGDAYRMPYNMVSEWAYPESIR